LNFEQVETFYYVTLTKSFIQTSKVLYISQPTVSARINALERELGHKLFYRNRKIVTLTQSGEVFFHMQKKYLKT